MYLGIEIGGTKLQLGVSDGEGARLVALKRFAVERECGANGILQQIKPVANELLRSFPIRYIGVGFGGPTRQGVTTTSHQVSGWNQFPLADWCQREFELPTVIANDCNVAALAEAHWGAGRNFKRVFYVTVGTGIGGGFVLNGKVDGTESPAIAEIGHLRPGLAATSPSDTVESYASGLGMARKAQQWVSAAIDETTDSKVPSFAKTIALASGDIDKITAKLLAEAKIQGCPFAASIFEKATRTLGWAIAQMITLLAPDVIVVGGGVPLSGRWYLEALRSRVAEYIFPPLSDTIRIQSTALDENNVVFGSILLAKMADDEQ